MLKDLTLILASVLVSTTAAFSILGCGGSSSSSGGGGGGSGSGCAAASCGGEGSCSYGCSSVPPEHEEEGNFTAPVSTGNYVWVANSDSGRVAYIDAATYEVKLVDAGNGPTYLTAVPDPVDDVALVMNVLSADATLLRASHGTVSAQTVPVPKTGNRWAVSNDGAWAIAWTDARLEDTPDPLDGFQDITVIQLAPELHHTELSIGYRPVAVGFDASSSRAFAVTQDGVALIGLHGGAPAVDANVGLADSSTEDAETRDVSVTPDGAYALVRREGASAISVFSLVTGDKTQIDLPGPATDLDLSADGKTAVAVVRETGQIALMPMPDVLADPAALELVTVSDAMVGSTSLAAAAPVGFFYTNAVPSDLLTVLDFSAPSPTPNTVLLRAPVRAVFPTLDASFAVALNDSEAGSKYAAAFSLVPGNLGAPPKIVGLDAAPISVALAPAGDHALIASGDDKSGIYHLDVCDLPSMHVTGLALASMPTAAGIVAGPGVGYVSQQHRDGRITFVRLATGQATTITGFELATQVVDGSGP